MLYLSTFPSSTHSFKNWELTVCQSLCNMDGLRATWMNRTQCQPVRVIISVNVYEALSVCQSLSKGLYVYYLE